MMASPATLNHFPPPSIPPTNLASSNRLMISCSHQPRGGVHVVGLRTALPSTPIWRPRRWRMIGISPPRVSDSTATVDDLSVASSSASSSEEETGDAAAMEKVGARVRVKVPLKVYHVPKVPEIELTGMEGTLKQYVAVWKGKKISATFPFKVAFVKEIDGRTVKFFAHLKEDEFEYID